MVVFIQTFSLKPQVQLISLIACLEPMNLFLAYGFHLHSVARQHLQYPKPKLPNGVLITIAS
jgi:hypothetical protein